MYNVTNPATLEVLRSYPTASDVEIQAALSRAHAAYSVWRETPLAERAEVLTTAAGMFRERAAELGELAHREMGKSLGAATGEAAFFGDIVDFYVERGPELLRDREFTPASGGRALLQRRPVGVLLGIMPWNYPYYQVARFVAPNLLLGNPILLKHAPSCPSSAAAIEAIFAEAGLPDGAYVNLFATNEQVAAIIADDRVQGVSLTGSERAGAAVAEIAGRHLKKVVLELGGSDPLLVLDTTDPVAMATTAYSARMANTGQACNSPKRMIVVGEGYPQFLDTMVRLAAETANSDRLAPLASEAAAITIQRQVDEAVDAGATLHVGGQRGGAFVTPAVLTGVTPQMKLYHEEAFGPVIVIHQVAGIDEAVALANDSAFGLGAVVYSDDEELALQVANRLDVGMVYINQPEDSEPDLPFGGIKRSGFGRELAHFGLDEFANHKLIRLP